MRPNDWIALAAVSVVYFAANYVLVGQFGVYEDDWIFLVKGFNAPPELSRIVSDIETFQTGRPLQLTMMHFGEFVLWATQSLVALYLITGAIAAFAIFLWYLVLKPRLGTAPAFVTATFVCVSALHTVAQFLNGALGTGLATALVMTAILMYRSKNLPTVVASYAVALFVLPTYEPFYLLFALAPWLASPIVRGLSIDKKRLIALLRHVAIVLALFVVYFFYRESRGMRTVASATGDTDAIQILLATASGAVNAAVSSFGYLAEIANTAAPAPVALIAIAALIAAIALIAFLSRREPISDQAKITVITLVDQALLSLALIAAGYALSYFVTSNFTFEGRESRVNLAGVFGHALLLTTALQLGAYIFGPLLRLRVFVVLSCVVGASFCLDRAYTQGSYAQQWAQQRRWIEESIAATPDARRGSAIIVETHGWGFAWPTPAIGSQPHGMPFAIEELLMAPDYPDNGYDSLANTEKPYIRFATEEEWPSQYAPTSTDPSRLAMTGWPGLPLEQGNVLLCELTPDLRIVRSEGQRRLDNMVLTRAMGAPSPEPTFWSLAQPRPAMLRLMPEVAARFSRPQ